MKGSDVFPSRWLKAEDIAAQGDVTLTIAEVSMQTLKNPQTKKDEEKPGIFWEEDLKPLLVNKTNWTLISDIVGSDESNDWIGHRITLFVMEVESFGDIVQAIRVRKPRPLPAKPSGKAIPAKPALRPQSEQAAADAAADEGNTRF